MSPDLRLRAKTLDASVIGLRVKEARTRAGLTQSQAAHGIASTAYISRIESGTRRPHADIVDQLARRFGVEIEDLLPDPVEVQAHDDLLERHDALRLELDYAELSLRTGSAADALTTAEGIVERGAPFADIVAGARFVVAQAKETQGDVNGAIIELEDLTEDEALDGLTWIRSQIALCRCYRVAGDLTSACELGARVAEIIERRGLSDTLEAVQMTMTAAATHFMRGETAMALRMSERALGVAERLGSPEARAAVLWNRSMFESDRGQVATAIGLAETALSLLQHTADARNIARLRGEIGFMQLRLDPPRAEEALAGFTSTMADLAWTSASAADTARFRYGLAKAHLILGDLEEARVLTEDIIGAGGHDDAACHIDALVLRGRIAAEEGRVQELRQAFHQAVLASANFDEDRVQAQTWFELAALLDTYGYVTEALDAYRRAALTSGMTDPVTQASMLARM